MRILVCVKRVPAPGARIVLTDDQRSIDARHLPFTVSPHEECAVEEAVRIKEKHGGTVTVMTLGPTDAEEQLRYAISVGADEAVLLVTDGDDWDPQATASALAGAHRGTGAFGRRVRSDPVRQRVGRLRGFQVGIRVAHALGRPVISGIKGIDIDDGNLVARRETGDGFEVYRLPLPAVVAVKEGINLPRYPTLPSRLKARKAELDRHAVEAVPGGLRMLNLRHAGRGGKLDGRPGSRPGSSPRCCRPVRGVGAPVSEVLVFVEHQNGVPLETSLQAVALGLTLGEVTTVSVGPCPVGGVSRSVRIEHPLLTDYAPEAHRRVAGPTDS